MSVEVKIGIVDNPREITVQSTLSQDEVQQQISDAIGGSESVLVLTDDKGARVVIPAARIAYAEIGEAGVRRVGFGAV